jgi:signal transduction histidine kinase
VFVSDSSPSVEPGHDPGPQRPADLARLGITRLRIEDGVSLETVFRHVTEAGAEIVNVERVGVWLLVDQGRALRCVDLYERSKQSHSSGVTLQLDEFPEYRAALSGRKTLPAEAAATDPRTSGLAEAYLEPLGIGALLDASILVGGELVGVVCHEHVGPKREWTTEERDFAGSMADLLALKIRAAEMEEAKIALKTQANQLAEARRLDSLAEMAAGVAHDLSNFLTVVLGGAEAILRDSSDPRVLESAHLVLEAGKKGTSLSKELMSIARPGRRSSKVIRPVEVVSRQAPLLQSAAGDKHRVVIRSGEAGGGGRVLISPEQLERMVHNLVINARDAMPDGGDIVVRLDAVEISWSRSSTGGKGFPRRSCPASSIRSSPRNRAGKGPGWDWRSCTRSPHMPGDLCESNRSSARGARSASSSPGPAAPVESPRKRNKALVEDHSSRPTP